MLTKIKTGKSCPGFRQNLSLLVLSLLFFVVRASAEVSVQALVDRNEMDPGDTFQLQISVTSDDSVEVKPPALPKIPGVDLLNQDSSEEVKASFVSTNEGRKFQTVHTKNFAYVFQTSGAGQIKIDAIPVDVGGKTVFTKPIQIRVAKGASSSARKNAQHSQRGQGGIPQGLPRGLGDEDDEEDLFAQLLQRRGLLPPGVIGGQNGGAHSEPENPQDAFFIQVDVDKTDVFAGEQVTASWYLYTRGLIRDIDTLKYPDLKGFWKEDIEIATRLNFTQEVVNGIPYKKALLASYALFPIKEGQVLVDSYKAKCSVLTGDLFGFSGGNAYTYIKASKELKINVKPVPAEGRPADYSGAVGQFQVSTRIEDPNIFTNQPFSFHVRFEGKGNAKLIDLPPVDVPQGLELYETQKEAKYFKTGTSYKDFNLLLIPRQEGDFVLPSLSVSIFDPQAKKYVTQKTEPVRIHVQRGKQDTNISNSPLALGEKKSDKPNYAPGLEMNWESSKTPEPAIQIAFCAVAFVLACGVLMWRTRVELGWGEKKKNITKRLRARLKKIQAKAETNDWRGVGVDLTNLAYYVFGEISGQGGAGVELEKLLQLSPPSVRRELGAAMTGLMEKLQILSFAPESVVGKFKEPAELKKITSEAESLLFKAVALGASDAPVDAPSTSPKTS